jgi:hypothetical protein
MIRRFFAVAVLASVVAVGHVASGGVATPSVVPFTTWSAVDDYDPAVGTNPHADRLGNADVWSYFRSEDESHDDAGYIYDLVKTDDVFGKPGLDCFNNPVPSDNGSVCFNRSGTEAFPGTAFWPDRAMLVHPGQSARMLGVRWTSPIDGVVTFAGGVVDRDGGCGDGINWSIDNTAGTLASGSINNGQGVFQHFRAGTNAANLVDVSVAAGDQFFIVVENKGDYTCDQTQVVFSVYESAGSPPAIEVNTTADPVTNFGDVDPGDGLCFSGLTDLNGDNVPLPECTLRVAVHELNTLAGADSLDVPAGTYTLHNRACCEGNGDAFVERGDIDITDDLTLNGAGADTTIVEADDSAYGGYDRVFDVWNGTSDVTLQNLHIRNGWASDQTFNNGGGVRVVGGSFLTVTNAIFSGNKGNCVGGAIYNWGSRTSVFDSVFTDNQAGGSCGHGGAIHNDSGGTLVVDGSTFQGNSAVDDGGAIWTDAATTIADSTFDDNSAQHGGAVRQRGGSSTIEGSTFVSNDAALFGGAIDFNGGNTMSITNSTFSANTSANRGGAMTGNPAGLTLNGVTFKDNTATNSVGGVAVSEFSTVFNTIFDGNTPTNCDAGWNFATGNNLTSDATCFAAGGTDLVSTPADLGALADNGGPTKTHAISADSPALDAADGDVCLDVDQRGINRPAGEQCDIGAYEFNTDVDGDGVIDPLDDCDLTPGDETADENGCSDSQRDADGDGANDAVDACPDTPAGHSVDPAGCSAIQLDGDLDGVPNTSDACASTPPTQDVGPDGCHHVLTMTKKGKGTVTSDEVPPLITCGKGCTQAVQPYASDDTVTLTAKPQRGYKFAKWTGDCVGKTPCVLSMSADRNVSAIFKRRR